MIIKHLIPVMKDFNKVCIKQKNYDIIRIRIMQGACSFEDEGV